MESSSHKVMVPTLPLVERIFAAKNNPGSFNKKSKLYMTSEEFTDVFGKQLYIIGRGAFAVVQLTDQNFAIKQFIPDGCTNGINFSALLEISILKYLDHPNILPIYGVNFYLNKCVFSFAMPLAQKSLENEMVKHFNLYRRKLVMYQILRGLAYCHSKLIWHLDIKPANILKFDNNEYKLADFGLSEIYAINNKVYSVDIMTPSYRAPEVLMGDKYYTETVDVWSAGVILLELIIGKNLFRVTTREKEREMYNIIDVIGSPNIDNVWPKFEELRSKQSKSFNRELPRLRQNTLVERLEKFTNDQNEMSILQQMVIWPNKREKAINLLNHQYFDEVRVLIEGEFPAEPIIQSRCGKLMLQQQIKIETSKLHGKNSVFRITTFSWILQITKKHNMQMRTLFLTYLLYDMYLSNVDSIPIHKEQLIILAAFSIAAKLTDDSIFSTSELSYISEYTTEQIVNMGLTILITLDFNIIFPTCADFSDYMMSDTTPETVQKLMYNLMAVIMTNSDWVFELDQHEIAQSAINIVSQLYQLPKMECFHQLKGGRSLSLEEIVEYLNDHTKHDLINMVLSDIKKVL